MQRHACALIQIARAMLVSALLLVKNPQVFKASQGMSHHCSRYGSRLIHNFSSER